MRPQIAASVVLRVHDGEGKALSAGTPDLTQAAIGGHPVHSLVSQELSGPIARIWILDAGATFDRIPPAERYAARAILRTGQAVLLLTSDARAEARVRCGLLDLIEQDDTVLGRSGHA